MVKKDKENNFFTNPKVEKYFSNDGLLFLISSPSFNAEGPKNCCWAQPCYSTPSIESAVAILSYTIS